MTEPTTPTGCATLATDNASAASGQETAEQRCKRLYIADGGPLIGWLLDESTRRGQSQRELADTLGVTFSYIYQLRTGARLTEHISPEMARACAKYLGVPAVLVKVLAGCLPMSDFVWPHQTEEAAIDRALDGMKQDPVTRFLLPVNVNELPLDAKRGLVLIYAESSGQDVFGVRRLPDLLQWLQRAALVHEENAALASE